MVDILDAGTVVFNGLNLFIVQKDRVTVALMRMGATDSGDHGAEQAHVPLKYERTLDLKNAGVETEAHATFPNHDGGAWIATSILGSVLQAGDPQKGVPNTDSLDDPANTIYRVRNLATLGVGPRVLDGRWPLKAVVLVDLFGGKLTGRKPALLDYQIEWEFRPPIQEDGEREPSAPDGTVDRSRLAEDVVWDSGDSSLTGRIVIANLPLFTSVDDGDPHVQLLDYETFYSVFTKDSAQPVLLPTKPTGTIDAFPVFCPPAMYRLS